MAKIAFRVFLYYFIVYGIIGVLIVFSEGLFDYQSYGNFFQRTSIISFLMAFLSTALFAFYSLISSFFTLSTFDPLMWKVYTVQIVFFILAIIGFQKNNKFILLIAGLLPIVSAIIELLF
ncbi:MAG TPA: hypothetical protein EYH16_01070 [Leucothrix mucor]|nr:hypothetical protein [Leucothrix mucor]